MAAVVQEPVAADAAMASGEVEANSAMAVDWVGLDAVGAAVAVVAGVYVVGLLVAGAASKVGGVRCASGRA